mgnify:CR=1 FL=1
MYGKDGKHVRTFECNKDLPSGTEVRMNDERRAIATKDYVVFYGKDYMRVFNKKDGAYVGDINLKLEKGSSIPPESQQTMQNASSASTKAEKARSTASTSEA